MNIGTTTTTTININTTTSTTIINNTNTVITISRAELNHPIDVTYTTNTVEGWPFFVCEGIILFITINIIIITITISMG